MNDYTIKKNNIDIFYKILIKENKEIRGQRNKGNKGISSFRYIFDM